MIARGEGAEAATERLCLEIEAMLPGVVVSVLRLERNGLLHGLSSPSLPPAYAQLGANVMIGPNVGSCGTAAYLRIPIAATDVESDPRWAAFRDALRPTGLKACWSSPIMGADGTVLGTLALYFREARGPTDREMRIAAEGNELCRIALEQRGRIIERERRATIDALTELPNRASFDAGFEHLSCTEPGRWGLLLIDLDNLKTINDTFGHHTGDALLQVAATRIAAAAQPDGVFRLGGDEFAVIVQSPGAAADLAATAARIQAALARPAHCNGHRIVPRATIGGAIPATADASAASVHRHADIALYHAKETGRGGFVGYVPGIGTAMTDRIRVIRDVGSALRDGRIDAYYQPIVRLDTAEIVGLEALCRLSKPDGEIVQAKEFHHATVDVAVAAELTQRMLERVAADVRSWLEMGIPFQHVGVNISSADFHSGTLFDRLQEAFGRQNVPLQHVILEVTESVYLGQNDPVVAQEIASLRAHGLRVALDDFGTGFASLTHLLTVPVDVIKIDKSFVDRLAVGDPSIAIVEGLIGIAGKLGIRVVAEGIEWEEQSQFLRDFGCRLGQGYLFSEAVPRDIATGLMRSFAQKLAGGPARDALPPPIAA